MLWSLALRLQPPASTGSAAAERARPRQLLVVGSVAAAGACHGATVTSCVLPCCAVGCDSEPPFKLQAGSSKIFSEVGRPAAKWELARVQIYTASTRQCVATQKSRIIHPPDFDRYT